MTNVLRKELMVKPSECNAARELPLTLLVAQMIDIATDHANELGIGFLNLGTRGLGWVLSRLSVEMRRWPRNGEKYILSTWIESYNVHFSERCFSVVSENGDILGYGRTIWMIIDLKSHRSVGTAGTVLPEEMIHPLPCPIPKMARHRAFAPTKVVEYTFKYTDLDFYRHVNTVKYIALLLNQFTLEEFDSHLLSRFDIAFAHEAKYGETAVIGIMEEEVPNPELLGLEGRSWKTVFEISVAGIPILSSQMILTRK